MNTKKGDYNDLTCEGNSEKYHTGKHCIEPGCNEPAGTAWSPYWCVKHNIERIDRIDEGLAACKRALDEQAAGGE